MAQLTCTNLSVGYEGRPVVSGLNLDLCAGDYLCVVGENGSGKSTLMRTLLGLKQPIEGQIAFGDGLQKNEIGYLPQQTTIQKDFPASCREVIQSGCLNSMGLRPFFSKKEHAMVEDNMRRMGITALAKRCYRELSGGQQQRVLLARALCATRKLLLLDEPVAGLDPDATDVMYELISSLNQNGLSIIMISHDLEAALKYSSHILQLGSTQVLFSGTTQAFVSRKEAGVSE